MSTEDEKVIRERAAALFDDRDPEVERAKQRIRLEELEAEERAEWDLPRLLAEERAEAPAAERREAWVGHISAARQYELIAERMGAKVPKRRATLAKTLAKYPPLEVPDDEFPKVREESAKLFAEDGAARKAGKLAAEEREAAGRLQVAEPGPYDKRSPHSWVRDVLAFRGQGVSPTAGSLMTPDAVRERLSQHGEDISHAVSKRSKFGERAAAIIHEHLRCDDEQQHRRKVSEWRREELRALGTDGGISATSPGEASAFVPPAILLKAWSAYRTPFASFAGQCKAEDMPTYGLNIYIPHVTGGAEVTSQTEGSSVAEKTPTAGLIKAPVVNKAGQVEVSQQYLDRAGPGIGGDTILFEQVKIQIDSEVDVYALNQALTEAQSVTNNTSSFTFGETSGAAGAGGFLNDVRKGKNLVATTAGTRLKATHLFASSKFTNYIEAWGTTIGGPVWTPTLDDNRLQIRSEGDPYGEGYSGYVLSQLAVFSDDNIPSLGTTSDYQVLIARPETVLMFRTPPIFYCYPETYSTTLDAALGARVYVAALPRWPEGMAALSGAFYKASLFA